MAFVQRPGDLAAVQTSPSPSTYLYGSGMRSLALGGNLNLTYEEIWRRQPAVRMVVGFIARQMAQIGTRVVRRISDKDVENADDHPLARLLWRPLDDGVSKVTNYHLINSLLHDTCIYDNAYWLKVVPENGPLAGVIRIPPTMVTPHAEPWFQNDAYTIVGNSGVPKTVPASSIVHFHGYNPLPTNRLGSYGIGGVSPMESLRGILAEEFAAQEYREQMWQNGARTAGYITRPPAVGTAKKWAPGDRERFRREWNEAYGPQGARVGGTPILEDGMTWNPAAMTPKDAQYVESRELTREEVAAAFWLPQSVVGLLDSATMTTVADLHVQLYQDSLAPWGEQYAQDIALQLLPDLESDPVAQRQIEVIFPFDKKMHGTPDQEIAAMSTATGRPFMSGNEARAWLNKPPTTDDPSMDKIVQPLNVTAGARADGNGIASPHDTAPDSPDNTASNEAKLLAALSKAIGMPELETAKALGLKSGKADGAASKPGVAPRASESHITDALTAYYDKVGKKVRKAVKSELSKARTPVVQGGSGYSSKESTPKPKLDIDAVLQGALSDDELSEDLFDACTDASAEAAKNLLEDWGYPTDKYDVARTANWLKVHADAVAESMNAKTQEDLERDIESPDPLAAVDNRFTDYRDNRAYEAGKTETKAMIGFGVREAAQQYGFDETMTKTWQTGSNPRPSHAAINGETVAMGEVFSNGARWPGDSMLPPEDRAGCNCDLFVNDTSNPEGEFSS